MRETLYEGRFIRLMDADGWEFADRVVGTGAVCIVAVDGEHIILIEEFRRPVQATVISLPAGLVDLPESGKIQETAIEAALRELREETGYTARRIEEVASGPISAGMTTERVTFVVAQDLVAGVQMPAGDEDIKVHRVALKQLPQRLAEFAARGFEIDPKIFAGLYFVRTHALAAERFAWLKEWRARVVAIKAAKARKAQDAALRAPSVAGEEADDHAQTREAVRRANADDALARLGKVLNWLGLTVGFVAGAWVLICIATLLGAFGSYTDTFGTAALALGGVVVGFLGWIAGRAALYVLAGR
jgi:ADP-ribose pyrophosphatase